VEERAWNDELQSYTQSFDSDILDAALLALPIYGYFGSDDVRFRKTYDLLVERLAPRPGAMYRYEQSLGEEGAFVLCAFWAAEYLAMGGGSLDEAVAVFEDALKDANDLGLLSEMVDPSSGELLGNFPQAFSHVGLINAALRIEERRWREKRGEPHAEELPRSGSERGARR
jgi:alpha,alpha-trehalase